MRGMGRSVLQTGDSPPAGELPALGGTVSPRATSMTVAKAREHHDQKTAGAEQEAEEIGVHSRRAARAIPDMSLGSMPKSRHNATDFYVGMREGAVGSRRIFFADER